MMAARPTEYDRDVLSEVEAATCHDMLTQLLGIFGHLLEQLSPALLLAMQSRREAYLGIRSRLCRAVWQRKLSIPVPAREGVDVPMPPLAPPVV